MRVIGEGRSETMDLNPLDPTPRQWRSLEELAGVQEEPSEFPLGALEPPLPGVSRRNFLQLMGASAALAATVACDRKGVPLVPYTNRPTEVVPGVTNLYASTFAEGGRAHPVLVRTREGRPIHVSGHDLGGKAPLRATADLLGLYDPDRLRGPMVDGQALPWDQALGRLAKGFQGERPLLLVSGASSSPTRQHLLQALAQATPGLDLLHYEGLPLAPAELQGWRPRLDELRLVLSLGADFLAGEEPGLVEAYAQRREPGKEMLHLWVAEGAMSLTGANADHRFLLRPSRSAAFVSALSEALRSGGASAAPPETDAGLWRALVQELRAAGPRALVLCGASLPASVHRAVHALNRQMGSLGLACESEGAAPGLALPLALQRLEAGYYGAVLLWGCNPLYASSEAGRWKRVLAKVPLRCWMGLREDESSAACSLLLPEHHWLEAWGDHVLPGGRLALQQPVVGALYDTWQGEEVLLAILRTKGKTGFMSYLDYLKDRWHREVQPAGTPIPFDRYFESALHDGLVRVKTPVPVPLGKGGGVEVAPLMAIPGLELLLEPDRRVYDGRYGNNGWLQELPEPVSKTAWGNPLMLSLEDAKRLQLEDGDLVRLDAGSEHLELPVCIQPGQAPGVLSLALGYGRSHGRVAQGVGVNAFPLLAPDGSGLRTGVELRKLSGRREFARTQSHHRLGGRDILRIQDAGEHLHASHEAHALPSLYPPQVFPEQRWGMVVDLNRCVGCSSCVLACQSENNIPIVGPEQVARGREMHWLRIDRYYEGDPANPRAGHQPMMCQHCDHAPCENVCPVNATNHSPDGLNQMVYNRCVGTRYCANNCPYKVRRFNFLEFNYAKKEPEILAHNPEVTVRPRGVMEKCTFCIQRIQDARVRAKLEKRPLKDGDITPACVAACPAGAIVFGDLKDPHSRVAHLAEDVRAYKVLEELGVRPAVTYLAALRHPVRGGKS